MIEPLKKHITVTIEEQQDGIVAVPEAYRRDSTIHTILCIGEGVEGFSEGDRVLVSEGRTITCDGQDVMLVREEDVLGFAEEE